MKISAKAGARVYEIHVDRENGTYVVDVDGTRHEVDAQKLEGDFYTLLTGGRSYEVSVAAAGDGYQVRHGAAQQHVVMTDPSRRAREREGGGPGPSKVTAAMPGRVVRLLVAEGDTVEAGQGLVVVEAMKMENEVGSPKAGKVTSLEVEAGQSVEGGATLVVVE